MSSPLSKLTFTASSRVTSGVLGVSLVAIGVAIYLTPSGSHGKHAADALKSGSPTPAAVAAGEGPTAIGSPSPTGTAPGTGSKASKTPGTGSKASKTPGTGPGHTMVDVVRPAAKTDVVVVKKPGATRTRTSTTTVVRTNPNGKTVTIHVPKKSALINPTKKYYGLAEDGLPGSSSLFDKLDTEAGKAPNLVEWFSYWDDSFSPQKVTQAWSRGALPVITWQSAPHDFKNRDLNISSYSMAGIASGTFDSYLKSFASSIAETGLPVGIRLDQEMNGNWYPWSAGYDARGIHNSPADFVAAWRHVWNVFQAAGANRYVIWAWTPSRTDTLVVDSHSGYTAGDTGLAEDYPGDDYVDWTGLSAYQFRPTQPATYDWIFGGTLDGNDADIGVKDVSTKPIFIAEMGSAQTTGKDTDNTATKVAFTTQSLAQFASDPRIVGFALFNNDVDGVHSIKLTDGTQLTVRTNWRFDSSPRALTAFKKGIAPPLYGAGMMPQPSDVIVRIDKP